MHQAKTMSTKLVALFALAVAAVMAVAATSTSAFAFDNATADAIINPTSKTVYVGKTATLKATCIATDEANDTALGDTMTKKWTSSNTKVATVSSAGTVKGITAGTAYVKCTFTFTSPDGAKRTFTTPNCKVTVKKYSQSPKITASTIKVKQSTVKKGKVTLKGKITTSGTHGTKVFAKVSGCKAIKVSSAGTITINKKLAYCSDYKTKKDRKGTHKIKVKMYAKGTTAYNKSSYVYKTLYIKIV
ncbi:MAG: Ig-like domain-containing protein [Coriobacteriia bacterium]|nr:Ig-like domain-containing protein [Coriobacteriia bacterium]